MTAAAAPSSRAWRIRVAAFLAVVGPGIIFFFNDTATTEIYTYSLAGAKFGYSLLWTMIPITVALVVVQEMAARMGAVTGKGLSDLVREQFGFRATFLLMIALIVTNLGNVVAEFAGVASSLELFGISRYIVVPVFIVLVSGGLAIGMSAASRRRSCSRRSTCATSSPACSPTRTGRRRPSRP